MTTAEAPVKPRSEYEFGFHDDANWSRRPII